MAQFVPAGSRITWVGYFDPGAFVSESSTDAIKNIGAQLSNNYGLAIESVNNGDLDDSGGPIALYLRTTIDAGGSSDSDDGIADIDQYVAEAFTNEGCPVTSHAVTDSTLASGATSANTSSGGSDQYAACSSLTDKFRNALPTWLGGTPVTPDQQACYTKAGQASVMSVASNAATAYGSDSKTAQVAQQVATQQAGAVATDTAAISDASRKAAASSDSKTLYLVIGGVAAVVVLIVVLKFA